MDTQGTEKRVVRVTIFQQPYSLRASGDPAETEAIARGVDDLMNQIADRSSSSDPARVAVLAALHLADKVRALETRAEALEARLRESGKRTEQAEGALKELERATHEEQSRNEGTVGKRAAGLYDRLTTLDERLASLLENGAS